jgi:hypothetical protein
MDIHRWLQAATDDAPPETEQPPPPPAFRDPPLADSHANGRTGRPRRRRRRDSDSSLIEPQVTAHESLHVRRQKKSLQRPRQTSPTRSLGGNNSLQSLSEPPTVEATEDQPPANTYERRARHKTKIDRYEPNQKKKRKKSDEDQGRATKVTRRKSHRSGDGSRTAGLVQSFQLKGGPKGQRLTVRTTTLTSH